MRGAFAIALCVVMGACVRAPRDPVLDMLDALGGRAAIDSLASLFVNADCTGPDGAFQTTIHSVRPGTVYLRQASARGEVVIGSTPERTWVSDGTATQEAGAAERAFVRGHEFHLLLFEIESRFTERVAGDVELVDSERCVRVTMRDGAGYPVAILLDVESHLPRMLELNPPGAAGPVRVFFADWRRIADLTYFESFRLTEGPERTFTYRYTDIAPNATPDPALWREP